MLPRTYTISQFLQVYNLSRSTLYRLWDHHQGPAFMRVGRRVLIPVDNAEAWVGQQIGAASALMAKQTTQGHPAHDPTLL